MTVPALTAVLSLIVPLVGEGVAFTAQAADKATDKKERPLPELPVVGGRNADGTREPTKLPHPEGARELRAHKSEAVQWPSAAAVTVDLKNRPDLVAARGGAATAVRAGDTPVLLGTSAPGRGSGKAGAANAPAADAPPTADGTSGIPGAVEVVVADRARTEQANVNGMLVGLKPVDTGAGSGQGASSLEVSLDYGSIADAYGGGFASRLRLVTMPECALTTPERSECRTRQPVASTTDPATQRISGTVALPGTTGTSPAKPAVGEAPAGAPLDTVRSLASGGGIALAAVAEADGSQGSYTATDLSATGSWSQNASGAFTYSYPITMPPSLTGTGPSVALSYDSQAVDGKTSARNSQAGWIGDGWAYSPGYIERSYKSCSTAGIDGSADECWAGWRATLSLGSHSGELIQDANGVYHLQGDDGTRIERLTGAANGLWQGEYFKVTVTDGTAYYLGLNHAPGTTSDPATNSAWGVPVYHPNSGDPCYTAAKGKNSQCDQQPGWRFNLDFVVDPHGSLQRYDWAAETNRYAMGAGQASATGGSGTLAPYTRGGYLTRVSYGYQLADALAGREPSARITFDTAERCVVSDTACRPENLSTATAKDWPDVPYDLTCPDGWPTSGTGTNVCRTASPTFWSTKRLRAIGTELRAPDGWKNVDRYDLKQIFAAAGGAIDPATGSNPATGVQAVLWLAEIRHTALDTTAGGSGQIALDPVTFAGTMTDNRVDGLTPAAPPLYRPRVIGVNTESGTSIAVTYRDAECSRVKGTMPASADSNTMACYPVYWTPAHAVEPIADWFQKTLVAKVTATDTTTANSPPRETSYSYGGGAAWHRDDSDLTDDQYRTWNEFRGYRTVTTTSGSEPDPVSQSTVSYFQGMDGDYKADHTARSVRLKNSLGEETVDSAWLAGTPQETVVYDQAGGNPVAKQFNEVSATKVPDLKRDRTAWTSKKPAPALSPLPPLEAVRTSQTSIRSSALLENGTWRTGRAVTDLDSWARPVKVDTQPDLSTQDARSCSTTTYVAPPASNPLMLSYPSRTLTVAGACGTTTTGSDTKTISDRRLIYDGNADLGNPGAADVLGQNGTTLGYVTATQEAKSYDAQGNPTYRTVDAQAFDGYGRVVRAVDETGAAEQTAYTPAIGTLPTEVATTNPLNWTSRSTLSPSRGLVTRAADSNNRLTDSTYDALGRRTAVWLPGNAKDAGRPADHTFVYDMHGVSAVPNVRAQAPSVTTRSLTELGNRATSVTIYDAFLKPRQTQATPANGVAGRVLTHTRYDRRGQVTKATEAWYDEKRGGPSTTLFEELDNESPSQIRYVYDGRGRQTAAKQYSRGTELWQSATAYKGADRTDTTPPNGGTPSTVFTDALGRTVSSVLHGGTGTGDVTTGYTFDARGNLATIKDNAGNTWSYTYDLQGRRVSQSDPDAGSSSTSYNEVGQIASTTDGLGKQLSFTYDGLGRTTGRYEGTNTGDQSKLLASYTYDTLAKGYLTSSTRYVGGAAGSAYVQKVDGYTARYQATSTTTTVPAAEGRLAGSYTQTAHYTDNLGLSAGFRYNADGGLPAENVVYNHDDLGEILAVNSSIGPLLDRANYNPLGQLLRSQYGNSGALIRTARTYDDITRRVTTSSVQFQEADANPISHTTYGYDQSGKLTSTSELQSSGSVDQAFDTQCFRYDGLNRLTEAWTDTWGVSTPTGGAVSQCNNSNPAPASLGGPAPYWQTFQYNQLGGRTQHVRRDVTGDTARDVTQTIAYPGNGTTPAAKPNSATSVTTRTGQATNQYASVMTAADGSALCMDVAGGRTADGTAVQTWSCNGTGAQRWTRPTDGTLRSLGKCAAPVGAPGSGTKIAMTTCNGSSGQRWQDGGNGAIVHTDSGLCLEIPGWNQNRGTQLGLWSCYPNPNHRWTATANPLTGPAYTATLTPQYDAAGNTTSRALNSTGTLQSAASATTPICLDATGGNSANGNPVGIWGCVGGAAAEEWTLAPDGTLRALGACARPVGGQGGGGTPIELWACDGSAGQRWQAAANGSLVHSSGLCLDIPGGNTAFGTRVTLWSCNQGPNQKWATGTGTQPLAGATQAFTYNIEGRTETVTTPNGGASNTSTYLYDANNELLIQRGPDGTILYLFGGAEQLTLSRDGTTVTGERRIQQPDGTTVVRSSNGALNYQFNNPQNTSTLQVDAATRTITRRPFDPYGNVRSGLQPSGWSGNRGYLGQPVDATSGLNLLGARNYDPVLGRFLTVDPLLAAGNPDQMGGYSYSSNDPVNRSDPSGLIDGDCWEGRCHGHYSGRGAEEVNFDGSPKVVDRDYAVQQEEQKWIFLGDDIAIPNSKDVGELMGVFRDERAKDERKNFGLDLSPSNLRGAMSRACARVKSCNEAQLLVSTTVQLVALGEITGSDRGSLGKGGKGKITRSTSNTGRSDNGAKTGQGRSTNPSTPQSEKSVAAQRRATKCETPNSFPGDVLVLLADGTTKQIADIQVGDEVLASDPEAGQTSAEPVTDLIFGEGLKNLVTITLSQGAYERPVQLTATDGHPFWVDSRGEWIEATNLNPGDALQSPDGSTSQVLAVNRWTQQQAVRNLTVADLHTYYVMAGGTPVLVHNCPTARNTPRGYPDRELPRNPRTGEPDPDPAAAGYPHTQLGVKNSKRNPPYAQAREFDADGRPVRDVDFTDHGRPQNHDNPHQHRWNENATGGTRSRGVPEPMDP
ncbi:ricin-type beta-trefoil lectin domain protein [Kitasatospora sp. NPDC057692]|uniref:ricin-type beta-trefoil lectin domain protein n=1 Tax=Kitasatospora sp. NPDC057692 TaxID=3346215 RepID=UPI00367417C0